MEKKFNKYDKSKKGNRLSPSEAIPIESTTKYPSFPKGIKPTHSRKYLYKRVFLLSIQAIFNAIVIGFIAKAMIALIDLVTNLFFYGKFSFEAAAPRSEERRVGKDSRDWRSRDHGNK